MHRQLMTLESIYEKEVANSKSKKKFKGRLFYAIVPNKKSRSTTFYYSRANADEARSVARCLPLFIRDHFKLEPSFYCSSNAVTSALEGKWDFKKRSFLTIDEADEMDKLDNLDNLNAEKKIYISKEHQKVMGIEGDDDISIETRLTKGDKLPTAVEETDDLSELTGETRESKAKAYAAEATREVAAQYIGTITDLKEELKLNDDKFAAMERKLEAAMKALATGTQSQKDRGDLSSGLSESDVEFLGTKNDKNQSKSTVSSEEEANGNEDNSTSSGNHTHSQDSRSMPIEDPPSPYRKSQDTKFNLGLKLLSTDASASPPKRTKEITPRSTRKNPSRSTPKSRTRSKSPATAEGSGMSL